MEELREENEFIGDCKAPIEEAGKGLALSSQTETLVGDGLQEKSCIEDSTEDGSTEKQLKADVGSVKQSNEKTVRSADAITEPETVINDMECDGTVEVNPVDVRDGFELCKDVQRVDETAMFETKSKNGESHESAGEEETLTSSGNEVTNGKAKCEAEQNLETENSQQSSVDAEMLSIVEKKAGHDKVSTKTNEDDNNKTEVDSEQEKEEKEGLSYNEQGNALCKASDADQERESVKISEEDNNKMDIGRKHANEVNIGLNEQENPGSETKDDNHLESAQVPEESTQFSKGGSNSETLGTVSEVGSATEISHEEEITNVNQKENTREAMEIDYAAEEQVETDVTVGEVLDNAGIESAGESMVQIQIQDVPIDEADRNDSNAIKEMEIDERIDNADMASDLTGTIESADSANPNSLSEDAAPGEVESLDHNAVFDPSFDITNFIDFSGVSSWSGNIKDLKTETGNVSLKEDKKATDMAEEVAIVDGNEALKSVEATVNSESHDRLSFNAEGIESESNEGRVAFGTVSPAAVTATDCPKEVSDAILVSEQNQEVKDHQCLDNISHEAPNIDSNQKEDTEMEENCSHYDYADDETGSNIKTNGVKRKADVLSEDSLGEGRKTVSLAKVSFVQMPSFKIGACIARAASQMAGSPSVLKGSIFNDETLSVESFVFQLHCAATDPVKENGVSDIAIGFFLDYRNSLVSQRVNPEKVSIKRAKTSNSDAGGTEAFEFEEMGDTYWKDRVIHNGGEEQTPPTEKGNYQLVPVEMKPVQVQRTRRPYRRRQSRINIPHPSALEKTVDLDENAPAELIMNFSETDTIPLEKNLSKMFRHFGPIIELQTEVDRENNRARVVFKKGADAKVAYNSAGIFNIFGSKAVNYELSHTITETFKVQPYIVSLGEEDAALCLTS